LAFVIHSPIGTHVYIGRTKILILLLINFKQSFYFKKKNNDILSTVSADRRLCIIDTRKPSVENIRSVGTEVAGIAEYFLAILDMTGNFASLCIQFKSKLVNVRMHFFFTGYWNGKKLFERRWYRRLFE
jgi:hypothetical protein